MRRIILKDVKIKQAEPEGGIDLPCIHTRNRGERTVSSRMRHLA